MAQDVTTVSDDLQLLWKQIKEAIGSVEGSVDSGTFNEAEAEGVAQKLMGQIRTYATQRVQAARKAEKEKLHDQTEQLEKLLVSLFPGEFTEGILAAEYAAGRTVFDVGRRKLTEAIEAFDTLTRSVGVQRTTLERQVDTVQQSLNASEFLRKKAETAVEDLKAAAEKRNILDKTRVRTISSLLASNKQKTRAIDTLTRQLAVIVDATAGRGSFPEEDWTPALQQVIELRDSAGIGLSLLSAKLRVTRQFLTSDGGARVLAALILAATPGGYPSFEELPEDAKEYYRRLVQEMWGAIEVEQESVSDIGSGPIDVIAGLVSYGQTIDQLACELLETGPGAEPAALLALVKNFRREHLSVGGSHDGLSHSQWLANLLDSMAGILPGLVSLASTSFATRESGVASSS